MSSFPLMTIIPTPTFPPSFAITENWISMSALFLFIAIGLLVALGFLAAARSGQYDDDYTPAVRMLFDDLKSQESRVRSQESRTKNHDVRREI